MVLLRRLLLGVRRALAVVVPAVVGVLMRGSMSLCGLWMWMMVVFIPAVLGRWRRRVSLRVVGLLLCVIVLMRL